MPVPDHPKVFHITHADNVPEIIRAGVLWSDAKRLELGLHCAIVGMSSIKERRLRELEVPCHPGTMVGEYVPFYFCPRSIMLYILHKGNHPEVTYHGGQGPIVHLAADLHTTVNWADRERRRWAFTNRNAGARYADFYGHLDDLTRINWDAVEANDFRDPLIKDGKQAEFLVHESFPWELIERIGVQNDAAFDQLDTALARAHHRPAIAIEPTWYY